MKVLLRSDFKWHECGFNTSTGRLLLKDNPNSISDTDVISIHDDERKKYVQCDHCGEILKNTEKAIKEHCSKKCDEKACFTCPYLGEQKYDSKVSKYTLLPDGTYKVKREETASLQCRLNYRRLPINSQEARNSCKYRNCKESEDNFKPINSFFIEYPNAFDELLTVDALSEKEWTFCSHYSNRFDFKARKKFTLYARANAKGIITEFIYKQRHDNYSFMYSKKYNQIFWINGGYSLNKPYNITATRLEEIKKVIERTWETK
jgi:hypothetical protein